MKRTLILLSLVAQASLPAVVRAGNVYPDRVIVGVATGEVDETQYSTNDVSLTVTNLPGGGRRAILGISGSASKETTNAALDKLRLNDGGSLTNVPSPAGMVTNNQRNVSLGFPPDLWVWPTFVDADDNLQFFIGGLTNAIPLAPNPILVGNASWFFRDGSMIEGADGVFTIANTININPTNGFGLTKTTDLRTALANTFVSVASVLASNGLVYAPEEAITPSATTNIVVTIATNGTSGLALFVMQATNTTLTAFTTPTAISITNSGIWTVPSSGNFNDGFYKYRNGKHWLLFTGNDTMVYVASSTNGIGGPYGMAGAFTGLTNATLSAIEGPSIFDIAQANGTTNSYLICAAAFAPSRQEERMGWSVTTNDWTTFTTTNQWASFSALVPVNASLLINHCTPFHVESMTAMKALLARLFSGRYPATPIPKSISYTGSFGLDVPQFGLQDPIFQRWSGMTVYTNAGVGLVAGSDIKFIMTTNGNFYAGGFGQTELNPDPPAEFNPNERFWMMSNPNANGDSYFWFRVLTGSGVVFGIGNHNGTGFLAEEGAAPIQFWVNANSGSSTPFSGATITFSVDQASATSQVPFDVEGTLTEKGHPVITNGVPLGSSLSQRSSITNAPAAAVSSPTAWADIIGTNGQHYVVPLYQ